MQSYTRFAFVQSFSKYGLCVAFDSFTPFHDRWIKFALKCNHSPLAQCALEVVFMLFCYCHVIPRFIYKTYRTVVLRISVFECLQNCL